MLRFMFLAVAALVLTACANGEPLARAQGPLFALNPGQWQPTPQDLSQPPMVPHD
jgi:outer membrane biogenesis lipoprotein LolB